MRISHQLVSGLSISLALCQHVVYFKMHVTLTSGKHLALKDNTPKLWASHFLLCFCTEAWFPYLNQFERNKIFKPGLVSVASLNVLQMPQLYSKDLKMSWAQASKTTLIYKLFWGKHVFFLNPITISNQLFNTFCRRALFVMPIQLLLNQEKPEYKSLKAETSSSGRWLLSF